MTPPNIANEQGRPPHALGSIGTVTRHLLLTVALLPILPSASYAMSTLTRWALSNPTWYDEQEAFFAVSAVLGTSATILIWRKLVLWTFGRSVLTALVAVVPFAQVIYPHPLWNAGCIADDILRSGQHTLDAGLWIWLTIWVWWGLERGSTMNTDTVSGPKRRIGAMDRRVVASVGYVPLIFGLYMLIMIAIDTLLKLPMNSGLEYAMLYSIAAIPAVVLWLAIWRRGVDRTPSDIRRAGTKAALCIGLPILMVACIPGPPPISPFDAVLALPVIGWGVWMVWTAWVWPLHADLDAEGINAPNCRACGYSLTGLRWTRCPECGDEPTLDELWRATAGAE